MATDIWAGADGDIITDGAGVAAITTAGAITVITRSIAFVDHCPGESAPATRTGYVSIRSQFFF